MPWPEVVATLERIATFWGLPLSLLVILGVLLLRRRGKRKRWDGVEIDAAPYLVPGSQLDEARAQYEIQAREHETELTRLTAIHERELRDKQAAAEAWKQLHERADDERRANGREVAEQLRTLDIALELVHKRERGS